MVLEIQMVHPELTILVAAAVPAHMFQLPFLVAAQVVQA
jgi:hypothetical protein